MVLEQEPKQEIVVVLKQEPKQEVIVVLNRSLNRRWLWY